MSEFWCSWRPQISDSEETEEGRNIKVEEMVEMNKSHKAVFACVFIFIFGLMLNTFFNQNNMLDIISHLCFCFCFQFGPARRANLAVNQ